MPEPGAMPGRMPPLGQEGPEQQGGRRRDRRWIAVLALDQERGRERPNGPQPMRRTRWPRRSRRCLACLQPLANGSLVCGEACDELAWRLVPTLSGDLWQPGRRY